MAIITTRAKDYNFPETSAGVFSDVANGDNGLEKAGASDLFMGPVTITSMQAEFVRSGGTPLFTYLKLYDAVSPFEAGAATGLVSELMVFQLWTDKPLLLTFPDGFTFTNGISVRAVSNPGSGSVFTDASPQGSVDVRFCGRKP